MIKKSDFIEIEYLGTVKELNRVFDLTSEADAKKHNLFDPKQKYAPVIICVGQGDVVKGLDDFLEGKELKSYTVEIKPDDAFGRENPKLMKIIPASAFNSQQIKPMPGLHVNFGGISGVIKTVSSGRCIIDFNHPLSGYHLIYNIKILRKVEKTEEKISSIFRLLFNDDKNYELKEGKLTVKIELPEQMQKELEKKIKATVPEIKSVSFIKPENKEKKADIKK